MQVIDAATVAARLPPGGLVEALRAAFCRDVTVPLRHHHALPQPDGGDATLLLMPAFDGDAAGDGRHVGIKIVTVFPGNAARGKATVLGSYLLLDGATGEPVAVIDGRELTLRRTAAASALAASYLAREDARHLVMVGAGALISHLVAAHRAVRPSIERVTVWARDPDKAAACAAGLAAAGIAAAPAVDLDAAVAAADVVSAATLSETPLVRGAALRPGTHVDLVGGYTPAMREADDAAVRRAAVFVDTRAGACHEAGDIVQPLASGVLTVEAIRGELADLCRGRVPGRTGADEITLFKSVGTALEDLAAAVMVVEGRR